MPEFHIKTPKIKKKLTELEELIHCPFISCLYILEKIVNQVKLVTQVFEVVINLSTYPTLVNLQKEGKYILNLVSSYVINALRFVLNQLLVLNFLENS